MKTIPKPAYGPREEIANFLSHGIGAFLSVIGLAVLLNQALENHSLIEAFSYFIFGASLIALYSSSTLYHISKTDNKKKFYKKLDHICIYYLIAGSYTPFLLLHLKGTISTVLLITVWVIALGGTIYKIKDKKKNIILSVSIYVSMGWLLLLVREPMMASISSESQSLLMLGGVFYTCGVPFYLMKKVPFHHALWHLMVLGGSISHFFAIKLA